MGDGLISLRREEREGAATESHGTWRQCRYNRVMTDRRALGWTSALAAALLLACLAHVAWGGSTGISLAELWSQLWQGSHGQSPENMILWRIRLPRACGAALIGAGLGMVGAAFQSLFRNPLAEPYVIGVSSGAALGGALAILAGTASGWAVWVMPGAGFVGGMAALALVFSVAGLGRGRGVDALLLAGVAIGAALSALVSVALLLSGQDAGVVLRWLLGSVTPMFWDRVAVMAVLVPLGGAVLWMNSRSLNAMAAGEFMAERMGVSASRVRAVVLVAGTAVVGASVGVAGVIPFLGLAGPHIARRLVGADLRRALPASALVGASLLLAADFAAMKVKPGLELPVGAVAALLGAPFLLKVLQPPTPTS